MNTELRELRSSQISKSPDSPVRFTGRTGNNCPRMVVIAFVGALLARLGAGRAIGFGLAVGALGLVGIGLTVSQSSVWASESQ